MVLVRAIFEQLQRRTLPESAVVGDARKRFAIFGTAREGALA